MGLRCNETTDRLWAAIGFREGRARVYVILPNKHVPSKLLDIMHQCRSTRPNHEYATFVGLLRKCEEQSGKDASILSACRHGRIVLMPTSAVPLSRDACFRTACD